MKQLWLLKVMTKGYDAPARFFVAAADEQEARGFCEDTETLVLEVVPPAEVASYVATELGGLALVAGE